MSGITRLHRAAVVTMAAAIAIATGSIAGRPALAQTPPSGVDAEAGQQDQASPEALRQTLRQLEQTLAREREAFEQAQQRREERLEDKIGRRDALGQNLLQAQLRLSEAEAEADQLTEKVETSTAEAKEAEDAAIELLTAASSAAERLTMHLEQVPGTDRLAKRVETAADELPAGESANRLPDDAEALTSVLEALATVHDRASRVSLRETELWTAPGRREQVELLSLGHAGFAYRTIEDGRFGLALASPQEAQGYRFSEALSPEQQAGIEDAIAAVRAADDQQPTTIHPPADVTGRIAAEAFGQQRHWLSELRAGGIIMLPLLGVAGLGLLLACERAWQLYARNRQHGRLAGKVIAAAQRGDLAEANRLTRRTQGAVGRTLAACLGRAEAGQHAMEDAIQEQLLHEGPRLQRFLGGLATLAAIAPLLGLLGTVTGIIETFGVIRAFGQSDPGLMAGGISQALVTTATGLTIAIPLLLLHALLKGRVDRILAQAEKRAATLLNVLAHQERSAEPTTAEPAHE
jgi:biopolymer transport protein ExbB